MIFIIHKVGVHFIHENCVFTITEYASTAAKLNNEELVFFLKKIDVCAATINTRLTFKYMAKRLNIGNI